jgi:hypothetical protein
MGENADVIRAAWEAFGRQVSTPPPGWSMKAARSWSPQASRGGHRARELRESRRVGVELEEVFAVLTEGDPGRGRRSRREYD